MKTETKQKFGTFQVTILSLVILSILATASVSYASSPGRNIYAHGDWTYSRTLVSYNEGPRFTTYMVNFEKKLNGTLVGTIIGVQVINEYPDGTGSFQYTGVFNGTVGSSSLGTALVQATGTFNTQTLKATISFSEGTGGLEGIKGSVISHAYAPFTNGTYSGMLHL